MAIKNVRKARVVEIEQDGEFLSVQIEVDGKKRIGKYMRYGWDRAAWSADDEARRLIASKRI